MSLETLELKLLNTVDEMRKKSEENEKSRDSLIEKAIKEMQASIADTLKEVSDVKTQAEKAIKETEEKQKQTELYVSRLRDQGFKKEEVDEIKAEHKKAIVSYIRKGDEKGLEALIEKKALSVDTDGDGGYLVTPEMGGIIITRVFESSPMRELASVQTISTSSLQYVLDNDEASSGWVGETESRSETNTPTFDILDIPVHEQYAEPRATQKLIDDASVDIEAWLAGKIADKLERTENTAFVTGNGVKKPRGILGYTPTSSTSFSQTAPQLVVSGSASAILADGLVNLIYALKEAYRRNATLVMNRSTLAAAMLLKDGQNNYLWQPAFQAGQPSLIRGIPVREFADMPDIAGNAYPIAIADFKRAYQIVDRTGIRILRDPYTAKPQIKFYTTKRVGGNVVNMEALKVQKIST